MWDLVKGVTTFFKARKVNTDSTIFKLHYQVTFGILLIFTAILAANQYVGKPIRCMHHMDEKPDEVLDTYCWIHSTYTVTSAFYKKAGIEIPYPGIDSTKGNQEEVKVYRFYQWVSFCLVFQAVLFYAPRWLWKTWEGGKLNALKMDLDVAIISNDDKDEKKKLIINYLENNIRYNNWWAYKYFICELLSLVNVIGQMFLMDRFLEGEFFSYGVNVISFMQSDQEERADPMIYVFPRMTKCTFFKYGLSGEVERHDSICILPLNIVNEKIYIFLWFWFIILTSLTSLLVLFRIVTIFSSRVRVYLLRLYYRLKGNDIDIMVETTGVGGWYLLFMIGSNIDSGVFREVFHDLAKKFLKGYSFPDEKLKLTDA